MKSPEGLLQETKTNSGFKAVRERWAEIVQIGVALGIGTAAGMGIYFTGDSAISLLNMPRDVMTFTRFMLASGSVLVGSFSAALIIDTVSLPSRD